MSKTLRLLMIAVVACLLQTNLSGYVRIAGVAPDFMIAMLVAATGYCGAYGGFCIGSIAAMLYDASVGYVLVLNLVGYTFIGWAAPLMRGFFGRLMRRLKHKSYLEMIPVAFILTLIREILYIGYLFLIGAEQSMVTLLRMLLCAAYTALLILPCSLLVGKIMGWHPIKHKRRHDDLIQDAATETHRS